MIGKYLKVPVKMANNETMDKIDEMEKLGIEFDYESELEDSFQYILIEGNSSIFQFNESDDGTVVLTIASGRWNTDMDFKVFLSRMIEVGYEIL